MARKAKPVPSMLDDGIKGYISNQARKHLWRVQPLYDYDDLVQEGYVCFAICKNKYGHVETASHFMSLFKTTFQNQIHDLASARTKQQQVYEEEESKEASLIDFNAGELLSLISKLPWYLQNFINLTLSDASKPPRLLKQDKERETNNEYYCRLLGIDPREYDLEHLLKSQLT